MRWRYLVVAAVVGASVLVLAGLSFAAYHTPPAQPSGLSAIETQLRTAIAHAGNSARSGTRSAVTLHLGHALNCIEGEGGSHFDASWGHVCQGQGSGILEDVRKAGLAGRLEPLLVAADQLAVLGVKQTDLAAAQLSARGVAQLLQLVLDNLR